ncbi:methyl-accepting chemotaxis protein [Brevibacillus ginsengisoli]|uniref:methyl-accepting chemotaxis protein n=1 Tax=Brevibacillus ginsengisoli TaxID=363854 RepID=UPI003CE82E76
MGNIEENRIEQLLECLKLSLPLVQKLFPLDVMFSLTDREKFIYDLPGRELDLNVYEGMPIPTKGGIKKCLLSEELSIVVVPKEVYGTPFKSFALPIKKSDGKTIGVFTMGISLTNQETLSNAANLLVTTFEEINGSTEEIANTASELANKVSNLKSVGQKVVEELQKTDEILGFIKHVAENSNLLGLNAAIEAARAGEHGLGFGVVAKEIRKMSVTSASSTVEIANILQSIKNNVALIDKTILDCLAQSERQAAATEEISASMQQVTASAAEIEKIAQLI